MYKAILFATISILCQSYVLAGGSRCPSKPDSLPDLISLGVPDDCVQNNGTDGSKCHIFLRMAPNKADNTFVDFYMEGNMTGWVAVGFSMDDKMVLTDVIGCKHDDKDNSYGVINTWNPDIKPKHNELDPLQNLTCSYSTVYEDKRLKCHFGRFSGIINNGRDYNLNGTYHIILGNSDNQTPVNEAFPYHTVIPTVIGGREFNVYNFKK